MANRRPFYQLTYSDSPRPVYFEDAGQLLKIAGVLWQGMNRDILTLMPTASPFDIQLDLSVVAPTLPEWSELLRLTDDPLVYEEDESGNVKSIHRKVESAISGAIQWKIWARDDYRCMFCGRRGGDVQLTIDHFVPLELGGANNETNFLSACRQDQKEKGCLPPKVYCERNGLDYAGLVTYLQGNCSLYFVDHLRKTLDR
jgi:5-methylcytosine-specific restriction endonuclease McrA